MKTTLLTLCVFMSSMTWADTAPRGCIAQYKNGIPSLVEVSLTPFEGGDFLNSLISISDLPEGLVPNESGSYCYPLNDDRLAYVTMYYSASKMIQEYNTILTDMGFRPIVSVPISLKKEIDPRKCLGDAQASPAGIQTSFQNPAVDYSTIDHEIGHVIHYHIRSQEGDGENGPESNGVYEGTGNLLAALHLGQSLIDGGMDSDPSLDMNQFVRYPFSSEYSNKVLIGKTLKMLKSKGEACETDFKQWTELAAMPEMQEFLDAPNSYIVSATINQPLWQASAIFGKTQIQKLYLKTLSQLKHNGFQALAKELVLNAKVQNPALGEYLQKSYSERGLIKL